MDDGLGGRIGEAGAEEEEPGPLANCRGERMVERMGADAIFVVEVGIIALSPEMSTESCRAEWRGVVGVLSEVLGVVW